MKTLIIGASGFSGKELTKIITGKKLLLSRNINFSPLTDAEIINCDLVDYIKIAEVIKNHKPQEIFHLAGIFSNNYDVDYELNVKGTKNLLESVKEFSIKSKILLVGSAAEYGLIKQEQCPIDENCELSAHSVYGLTKIFQKSLMDYYVNVHSLNIVMARPFNLYGKGISERLFIGKVYQGIEKIKKGLSNEISLGNLDSERDYISVTDAVQHFVKIMKKGNKGEVYNVACGFPTKTETILRHILKQENIDFNVVKSNTRPAQANDSDIIYADINKLKKLYDK
jgi:GDP-4-dehydro-6-deoxy-D-mannose reductase